MNGYQLLNDVGSGGTLSSLFTILSLFTENIQLRWSDDDETSNVVVTPSSSSPSRPDRSTLRRRGRFNSDVSNFDLGNADTRSISPHPAARRSGSVVSSHSSASTIQGALDQDNQTTSLHIPTVSDDAEQDYTAATWSPPSESKSSPGTPQYRPSERASETYFSPTSARPAKARQTNAPQQGIIARAVTDTTLAVIPAEAFRRLTQKFPKASAHIVQGRLHSTCFACGFADLSCCSHFNSVLSCYISVCAQILGANLRIVENRESY